MNKPSGCWLVSVSGRAIRLRDGGGIDAPVLTLGREPTWFECLGPGAADGREVGVRRDLPPPAPEELERLRAERRALVNEAKAARIAKARTAARAAEQDRRGALAENPELRSILPRDREFRAELEILNLEARLGAGRREG